MLDMHSAKPHYWTSINMKRIKLKLTQAWLLSAISFGLCGGRFGANHQSEF